MEHNNTASAFAGLIDLASEKNGGKALIATDEFFAAKENLLREGRGIFIADKFTENGKWMDGWESRRKRIQGFDWCIIKLGVPGIVKGLDIDTNHFLGNHPPYSSVEACNINEEADTEKYLSDKIEWTEILPKSPLNPGSQNLFSVNDPNEWTHIKLKKKIIVDTNYFKGNFPDSCSIEGCSEPEAADDSLAGPEIVWKEILPKTKLKGDLENTFEKEIKKNVSVTHVRLNIFPDGGVSRLRLFGIADR
ncbi:MAG: allantoicase [Ignavibacteria bacterium]|nr:allantoicase [Ignavibacteria bacterium]